MVRNVNRLVPGSTQASEAHMIRGLPWKILVIPRQREGVLNSLGFFLQEGFEDFFLIFFVLWLRDYRNFRPEINFFDPIYFYVDLIETNRVITFLANFATELS